MNKDPRGIVFWILLGSLCIQAVLQTRASFSWGPDSWPLTDFLIDYSGGFVRRGLPGTMIWWTASLTGIQGNHLVIAVGLAAFVGLLFWMLFRLGHQFHPALLVSCVVLGIPAYQEGILRKDCLGLLALVLAAGILAGKPSGWQIFIPGIVGCIAVLSHETFMFYGVAGLLLARHPCWSEKAARRDIFRVVLLAPALFAFVLSAIWHGNEDVARAIHRTWMPLWERMGAGGSEPGAAIRALGWSKEEALGVGSSVLLSGWYQTTAWFVVFVTSFLVIIAFTEAGETEEEKAGAKSEVAALLLMQLVMICPLFVLGMDYGRWLFFWVASSMILFHAGFRAPSRIVRLFQTLLRRVETPMRGKPALFLFRGRCYFLLAFGVPVCWNAINFLNASPVGRYLGFFLGW